MDHSFTVDLRAVEKFLKLHSEGQEVESALKLRTISHWIDPNLDIMIKRMVPAYEQLCKEVDWPFNFMDCGCMSGYLKHFMQQRLKQFRYIGVEKWKEAITIAKDMDPYIEIHQKDLLKDDLFKVDYVWCSNIYFPRPAEVISHLLPYADRAAFFAMPPHCGDYEAAAKELGHKTESWKFEHTNMVKVYGNNHIRRVTDSGSELDTPV